MLSDLRARSLTELMSMTKTQLVNAILEGIREVRITEDHRDARGSLRLVQTEYEMSSGKVMGSRAYTWSYYPTGEVDEIAVVTIDAGGVETGRQVIKHYTDGRQPVVIGFRV